jgi:hypothetical protein
VQWANVSLYVASGLIVMGGLNTGNLGSHSMSKRSDSSIFQLRMLAFMILGSLTLASANADQPTAAKVGDRSQEQESLNVRYARAHLALANLDLRRAMDMDNQIPNFYTNSAMESLRRHVAIDQEQLKQAIQAPNGNFHDIFVRSAEASLKMAKADLRRKQKAREKMPSDTSIYEEKRAEAIVEIAKLQLEITNDKESSQYSLMYLQWQIEELRNQVLELQLQVKLGR